MPGPRGQPEPCSSARWDQHQTAARPRRPGSARNAGYADLATMLAEHAVDVVHICMPNASHAELALTAVQAGLHVA
ncbi:MAG: Gfo/Idh/MocA family oxidoreductase [Geodermatophilaceae bacterium]|nr:Gfo/Idh/MocA family oxidoreductase [Geodermatophilaceae bacterium]